MVGSPERLKPRHIAVQGLRILLPRLVDELSERIANCAFSVNFWRRRGSFCIVTQTMESVDFTSVLLARVAG